MISVILPTLNSGERLRSTLDRLADQKVPVGLVWEIVVVDNGSEQVELRAIERAVSGLAGARLVIEQTRGVANAKNTGVRLAKGQVLAFLDDDVHVPANWLTTVTDPIVEGVTDIVAGAVHIAPHLNRPDLTGYHLNFLADTLDGLGNPPRTVHGASMACRRRIFDEGIDFPLPFGPGLLGFLEESIWFDRAIAAGFSAIFVDGAPAEHHFNPDRLTRAAWIKRAEQQGLCEGYYASRVLHSASRRAARRATLRTLVNLGMASVRERSTVIPTAEYLEARRLMAHHREVLRNMRQLRAEDKLNSQRP